MLLCVVGADETSEQLVVHIAPNLPQYKELDRSVHLSPSLTEHWRVLTVRMTTTTNKEHSDKKLPGFGQDDQLTPSFLFHHSPNESLNYSQVGLPPSIIPCILNGL